MAKQQKFKPVDPKQDFVAMEKKLLDYWYKEGIVEKYLKKNRSSKKKFSFLDGPITANNPMGIHHAWGRTYKDLWQRFYNMQGYAGRFQNGFDEQGLWVEVEVEKELGFKNKKDIEKFGIDKFVNLCKERVKKFSRVQTEQSKRLGYFMDWENSYHTSSDENNYAIWNFLKVCNQKGYLYKGRDSVPWCPRCGTAISQHEILTEEYKEITHDSIYFKLPLIDQPHKYLLVWTTTPWTIPGNVAVTVDPKETYTEYPISSNEYVLVMKKAVERLIKEKVLERTTAIITDEVLGASLLDKKYIAPFDDFEGVKKSLDGYVHKVVASDEQILPISSEEGTGIIHLAPGAGAEDFAISKKENLPVVELIDEEANYLSGLGKFSGQSAKDHPELITSYLKEKDKGNFLLTVQPYTHRYPTCWRCKTELVWRVVDEWYIAMDRKDPDDKKGRTLRQEMVDVAKKITWIPKFGLGRELDWLKNMHDWLISKERYWGLALPIWECTKCGSFEVIGSKEELKERAVAGWDGFEGQSPHRPQIDEIKIKCSKCAETVTRIKAVGNVWLDAGIVPFSTMSQDWFPADFITESFPGQFKNWFYSLIAMSTVLKNENSFKTVLGFATLLDEKGEEMHKSKGNAIEFNEAADKIGVDVMRWMYAKQNPVNNLLFGYHVADEVRRRFYLILWNVYSFFVTYANLNDFSLPRHSGERSDSRIDSGQVLRLRSGPQDREFTESARVTKNALDNWIISRLNSTIKMVTDSLTKYDAQIASTAIEDFVIGDLSTWYIRRSRDRVEEALPTIYDILVTLSKLLSPFTPFIAEEIYMNLVEEQSVNLADFPTSNAKLIDKNLEDQMAIARTIVEKAHSARKEAGIKVRQPLASLTYGEEKLPEQIEKIIADEVNVKEVITKKGSKITLDTKFTPALVAEGQAREIIRSIQQARKDAGCDLAEKVTVTLPDWPKEFEEEIKKQTLTSKLVKGKKLEIIRS
ncbi:MAG: class I tRNA ligase family protein [Candidatus Curtissbacteria bacterium]|nr:class I tRNA ligase family protein [Candidatus Curtissbacteria bacterium]